MHRKRQNDVNRRFCYLFAGGVLALGAAFYPISANANESANELGLCVLPNLWSETFCPVTPELGFEQSTETFPWAWDDSLFQWQPEDWAEQYHSIIELDPLPPLLPPETLQSDTSGETELTIDG